MNILFDLLSIQVQHGGKTKFHGGGEFATTIFEQVIRYNFKNKIFVIYDIDLQVPERIKKICAENLIEEYFVSGEDDLENLLKEKSIDRFVINIFHPYFKCKIQNNIDVIYTCHDLRNLNLPLDETYKWYSESQGWRKKIKEILLMFNLYNKIFGYRKEKERKLIKEMLARANTIITVSNYSKYSILNEFPQIQLNKLVVSYSPAKKYTFLEEKESKNENVKKYFLLISVNRFVKNSYRAVVALDNLLNKFPEFDFEVICVGGISIKIKNEIKNINKFKFLNYVTEKELERLYKNAFVFLYPSLYEGFGYPPLEAMKYGTIVMASATTSIPEICGDSVIYFNPYSIEDIQNKALYILNENPLSYKEKGVNRYKEISKIQRESLKNITDIILGEK